MLRQAQHDIKQIVPWIYFFSNLQIGPSTVKDKMEIIRWDNKMRDMRISEMPDRAQEFLEGYIQENLLQPQLPVHVWFDVFDIEEGGL